MADGISVAAYGSSCEDLFQKLCELSKVHTVKNYPTNQSIEREHDRFKLWARNIAALQDARYPSSLGYRIRHDSRAQKLVKNALKYLEESLYMAIPIVSSEEPNETWDSTNPTDDAQSTFDVDNGSDQKQSDTAMQSSELDEIFTAIQGGVTHLFRLSMIIRKKPETDEYVKAANKVFMDPTSDIIHVKDKYPRINAENTCLSERLGTAITSRRQYLLFRREHQKKLSEIHNLKTGKDGGTSWSGTRASTLYNTQGFSTDKLLQLSISTTRKAAQTEYANSSKGTDGSTSLLRTPLLPKNDKGIRYKYGDHFECPFCWRPQEIGSKPEWKKHVFSDLRPYVCTFESCNTTIFESQNEWFKHELDSHRRQWSCIFCQDQRLKSRQELESHISEVHSDLQMIGSSAETMGKCLASRISALDCPLCNEYGERLQNVNNSEKCDVSLKQFQQHLGRHMEQLALSALPTSDHDSDNSEDDIDDTEDEFDNMSSLKFGERRILRHARELLHRGKVYEDEANLERAVSVYEEALEMSSGVVGLKHPLSVELAHRLGSLRMEDAAEKLLTAKVIKFKREFGEDDPRTLKANLDLVNLRMKMVNHDKAEPALRYLLGRDDPQTPGISSTLEAINDRIAPSLVESDRSSIGVDLPLDHPLPSQDLDVEKEAALTNFDSEVARPTIPHSATLIDSTLHATVSASKDNVQAPTESFGDEPYTIKCISDYSDDDGNAIRCETCGTWQHIECYYPGNVDNVSKGFDHSCVDCKPRTLDRRNTREHQKQQGHPKLLTTGGELASTSDKGKQPDTQGPAPTRRGDTLLKMYGAGRASLSSNDQHEAWISLNSVESKDKMPEIPILVTNETLTNDDENNTTGTSALTGARVEPERLTSLRQSSLKAKKGDAKSKKSEETASQNVTSILQAQAVTAEANTLAESRLNVKELQKMLAKVEDELHGGRRVKEPIRFEDALNRKFQFPFEISSTWEGMEELIKQAFKHVDVLGPLVTEGQYDLMGPHGVIILPAIWGTTIEPGMSIRMTMWSTTEARGHSSPPQDVPIPIAAVNTSSRPKAEMKRLRNVTPDGAAGLRKPASEGSRQESFSAANTPEVQCVVHHRNRTAGRTWRWRS